MDTAELVLDYIDTLKWPIVVVALVGPLLWVYRGQLGGILMRLVERTRSVEVPGGRVTFDRPREVPTPDEPPPGGQELTLDEVQRKQLEETLNEYERTLTEHEQTGLELQLYKDQYTKLAQEHVMARVYLYYEQVYRFIFGSQIQMLDYLNLVHPGGRPRANLDHYYSLYTSRGGPDRGFDLYVNFLLTSSLIQKVEGADEYRIADYGRGFLAYLTLQQIPKERNL